MKVAIASNKKSVDESVVCNTAGRAPFYFIFNNKELVKTIKNPFAVGGGGAGPAVAKMLANEDVSIVLCKKFGDKMINNLKERDIEAKEVEIVPIKDALELIS